MKVGIRAAFSIALLWAAAILFGLYVFGPWLWATFPIPPTPKVTPWP